MNTPIDKATPRPVNLEVFKEQLKIVTTSKDSKGNKFNTFGTMNAACWIGEHSGCLIKEIEHLRKVCETSLRAFGNGEVAFMTKKQNTALELLAAALQSAEKEGR